MSFDVLVRDLLQLKGDPYPLGIRAERIAVEDEVGRLGVTTSGRSGQAGAERLGDGCWGRGCGGFADCLLGALAAAY